MLRSAFVQTLEAKAVLELAEADMEYYDKIIDISKARFAAGDLAQIDLDRIELLRVQYETEIQTAIVNLRTAKIALLQLLDDDLTPVDRSTWRDFSISLSHLQPLRLPPGRAGFASRSARRLQTIEQAQTNHTLAIANGSTIRPIAPGTPTTRRTITPMVFRPWA